MSLFRSNRLLFYHLRSISHPSTIFIRHATEIRSRRILPPNESKTKQRKNTVNPVAQVKKLGDKAGKILSNENLEAIYNRFDPLREDTSKDPAFLDELATVKNPLQNVTYLKDNDIRFSNRIMKAKSRQERYKKGYVLLEGKRLIADAIQAGADLLTIFVTDRQILNSIDFSPTDLNFTAYQISPQAFRTWSDVQTSQGVMAIFAMPQPGACSFEQRITLPITVICDNIRDPGNLGTIIRTCASAGCDRLIATKGCVDIWDPKVIRSAMGAHFRLPLINDVGWETIPNHIPERSHIYLADHKYSLAEGNPSLKDDPSKQMFEEMLEKRKEMKQSNSTNDQSYLPTKNRFLPLYKNIPIGQLSLWQAFSHIKSSDHSTVILGGETEGISLQARKLTIESNGKIVYIPLLNDVESLNVGIALSVILFQLRRSYEDLVEKSYSDRLFEIMGETLTDEEKATVARRFIAHAPPGEFNEVFNDVRTLLNDDALVRKSVSKAFAEYNRDQYIPTKVPGSDEECLITDANDLGDNRFYDPRTRQSFKFDHLRREASEAHSHPPDEHAEPWRLAVEKELTEYIKERYTYGASTVIGGSDADTITLAAFIESHKFEPKNYWNGRWRSKWSMAFSKGQNECELTGLIKAQVHYFEDGNVQLVSSKDITETIQLHDETTTAKDIIRIIRQAEDSYQQAVNENYQVMSDSTFKALRRQLPITKAKIDWTKITAYKIGSELKNA